MQSKALPDRTLIEHLSKCLEDCNTYNTGIFCFDMFAVFRILHVHSDHRDSPNQTLASSFAVAVVPRRRPFGAMAPALATLGSEACAFL